MSDYKSAIWMPVPIDYVFIDRWGYAANYIILHKTAGGTTAQGTAEWFLSGSGGAHVSTTYIVGLDGTIVQCVAEKDGAGGNGILEPGHDSWWSPDINPNLLTISIECVDPATDNSTPMPPAQKDALFPLIKDICTRRNIPMRPADATGGITGHYSIAPQTRAHCPGNFAWDEMWAFLGTGQEETLTIDISNPTVTNYFDQIDEHHWHCKTAGHDYIIQFGILDFYKSFGGNALCGLTYLGLPTGSETPVAGKPGVVTQEYERGTVAYDAAHVLDNPPGSGPVYLMHRTPIVTPSKSITKALSDLAAANAILQTVQHDLAS